MKKNDAVMENNHERACLVPMGTTATLVNHKIIQSPLTIIIRMKTKYDIQHGHQQFEEFEFNACSARILNNIYFFKYKTKLRRLDSFQQYLDNSLNIYSQYSNVQIRIFDRKKNVRKFQTALKNRF